MNRTQVLDSINAAYRTGFVAPGVRARDSRELIASLEDGETIYWKRRSGKVASFFRCLLG